MPLMTLRSLLAFAALGLCLSRAQGQDNPLPLGSPSELGLNPERLERLHAVLNRTVDDGSHAGYILLIAREGRIVDWRAHGVRNVATGDALQKDDIVRMFSMSKLITSTAILMLVEEGRLKLNDPVGKYLPALAHPKVYVSGSAEAPVLIEARSPVTIRELLTHTSGYYYDFTADGALAQFYTQAGLWNSTSMDEYIEKVSHLPLAAQPGTAYRYSISTDILGAVVEKVSGMKFSDFLEKRIFAPLGMKDSAFALPKEKHARVALVHVMEPSGKLGTQTPYAHIPTPDEPRFQSGGGGLYSTAADYVRFAQMLLNGGKLGELRLLGRKTIELMTANHLSHLADPHPFGDKAQGFGLGVRVLTDLGQSPVPSSVGSFGWDGMATTNVQIDPRERTVTLLLYQHLPFNEGDVFGSFNDAFYPALE